MDVVVEQIGKEHLAEQDNADTSNGNRIDGVIIGILSGFQNQQPMVVFPGNTIGIAVAAKCLVPLQDSNAGREVALMFDNGDITQPIIMGLVHKPASEQSDNMTALSEFELLTQQPHTDANADSQPSLLSTDSAYAVVDGKRVLIEADEEMVLKCGRSSITLTRSGKVIIRGAYVSTKPAGVNRIKGGSVQIN